MNTDEVKPKLELISLFSIPVVKTNIGRSFTEKEIDCITNIPTKRKDSLPYPEEAVGKGRQSESYDILNKFASEELKDLKTFCEQELKRYLKDIEGVNTDITNLSITASWLNKIEPEEFHALHNHKNSHLSGILYIHCLPNDSIHFISKDVRFHDTTLELPKNKITEYNAEGISVSVKEGDLLLFPSWVPHSVSENRTVDKERLSISFDSWPTYLPSLYYPFK